MDSAPTSTSLSYPRRSRGSTASLQSSISQYTQVGPPNDPGTTYQQTPGISHANPASGQQHLYPSTHPEQMILRLDDGHHRAPNPNGTVTTATCNNTSVVDPVMQMNYYHDLFHGPKADSFYLLQGSESQSNPVMSHVSADIHAQQPVPELHHHHTHPNSPFPSGPPSAAFCSTTQTPDPSFGDPEERPNGRPARRERVSSTSIANDSELKRLLREYDGYNLHQMASEVQKYDGAGGKSEKIKQVFAMIWLRENCRRETGSVRRDRVYCSYAEKCGTERVSVLNPASFGKLVRAIFPNVQTRRLGVRGESKYHYVDLTLKEPEDEEGSVPVLRSLAKSQLPGSRTASEKHGPSRDESISRLSYASRTPSETTESIASGSRGVKSLHSPDKCRHPPSFLLPQGDDSTIKDSKSLLARMLQLTPSISHNDTGDAESLQLPSIHQYLSPGMDAEVADALSTLYRSHCISVIDSFRFCKEKNLYRHFASLAGTLTVPVHRLFVEPEIAPWIEECDWLMYQKMVAFVAPLTTQVVPDNVLKSLESISKTLVGHIQSTLKTHPEYVLQSRSLPAQTFSYLLRRFLDVNQSANAAAAWLCHVDNRDKMWEDFAALVNVEDVVTKSTIPHCSVDSVISILETQVQELLATIVPPSQSLPSSSQVQTRQNRLSAGQEMTHPEQQRSASQEESESPFPDKWVSLIAQLSSVYKFHRAQCIIDRAEAVWCAILHRLTLSGAQSFSAWWMSKVFFMEMLYWQMEKDGFMSTSPKLLREKAEARTEGSESHNAVSTRASTVDGIQPERNEQTGTTDSVANMGHAPPNPVECVNKNNNDYNTGNNTSNGDGDGNGNGNNNDDSAIDMGDDSVLVDRKYNDLVISDAVDTDGDVVVV